MKPLFLGLAILCSVGPIAGCSSKVGEEPADPPAEEAEEEGQVSETEISPAATMRVSALRYDSETGELTWVEHWMDWEQGQYDHPEWHRVVSMSPGERIEQTVSSDYQLKPEGRRYFTYGKADSDWDIYVHDVESGQTTGYKYPESDTPGRLRLLYFDGEHACFDDFLGDFDHRLYRGTFSEDGFELTGVLVDTVTMMHTQGSPNLVSMSADGSVYTWTNVPPHYDRIHWVENGTKHTYRADPLIESFALTPSGKYLYVIDRDNDDRLRVIDTATEKVRTLAVYPFQSAWLTTDVSSDDVVVSLKGDVVLVMSPEGNVKRVFNLLAKEGDQYWE